MSSLKRLIGRLTTQPPSFTFIIVFFIILGICLLIPMVLPGEFSVAFTIHYDPTSQQVFPMRYAYFVEFITSAFVFPVAYWLLMKWFLGRIPATEETTLARRKSITRIENLMVVFLLLKAAGEVFHIAFNAVNGIDLSGGLGSGTYNGYDTSEIFFFIYFMDEIIGHLLVMIPYVVFLFLALWVELLIPIAPEQPATTMPHPRAFRGITTGVAATCIGILGGYVAIASETGPVILCIFASFFIWAIIYRYKHRRLTWRTHPLFWAFFIGAIIVFVTQLCWILWYGIQPFYPFYSANLVH
jgi:hypothetical protein